MVVPPYLNFPVLRHLDVTSYHIPWFLGSIISNPKTMQYLPNLSTLTISILPDRPKAPNLNQVFESLAKLVNLENSSNRCPNWLSSLKLNAKGVKASVFLDSLNSCTSAHSTDASTNREAGVVFPPVRELHLDFRHMLPELDIFNPLLRLLALFSKLKHLELGPISKDSLRMRRGSYWEAIRARCPELEEVVFEDFRHLPAKVDDLVKGEYPCVFL